MKEQTARFDGLLLVSDIDGTLTELPQQMYCDARGSQPVYIWDIQNGMVFLQYDYRSDSYPGFDYDGNPCMWENISDVCGIIPLQDLLAGSQNYRELTYD